MKPQQGNVVRVHYTGKLSDGTVFDSSRERDPIEFALGEGQVIPGFEAAVCEMEEGDTKTVTIEADKAYGPSDPSLVQDMERSLFPEEMDIEPGQQFQAAKPDGQTVILNVVEANDDTVTVDANHPLAGKDLTFELELTEVVS